MDWQLLISVAAIILANFWHIHANRRKAKRENEEARNGEVGAALKLALENQKRDHRLSNVEQWVGRHVEECEKTNARIEGKIDRILESKNLVN